MPKPKPVYVWIGVGLALLATLLTWGVITLRKLAGTGTGSSNTIQLTAADINALPADVRDAADKLRSSKVGYALTRGNKTYVIISTGSDSMTIRYDKATKVANQGAPAWVDVHLARDVSGSRLLVLQATIKDPKTDVMDYQFDVDSEAAAIPTLHNPHNLPLVALPTDSRFVVLDPVRGQVADQFPLRISGYARVFEGNFTVTILSETGKELGKAYVRAAGAAPGWGSFVGDLRPSVTQLPATGTIVFQGDEPAARLVIPVRFRADGSELG